MDMMDDEDLKKSVIDQMMGELDDVTSNSLKKSSGPVKGVEITIAVQPHHGDDEGDEDKEAGECTDAMCRNPEHQHPPVEAMGGGDADNYISDLLKKLG